MGKDIVTRGFPHYTFLHITSGAQQRGHSEFLTADDHGFC